MGNHVVLVQQSAWDSPRESMPLAAGYLKAAALADAGIRQSTEIEIVNFRGGEDLRAMARRLLEDRLPDVLGFSVLGWNQRAFGELATTYRQLNPDGLVVFGGDHVTNQGERVFALYPCVDVVVNGEGERTFVELLQWHVAKASRHDLGSIAGISFQDARGAVVTTSERPRIDDLDEIPSPFLTGAIPLTDDEGNFRYDVAIFETNRGCPYKCTFCYWGGAIGTRVREFAGERLRDELTLLAQHKVETVALCDANFGMRKADLAFVERFLEVRERYGYPRFLESCWTKNKSDTFFEIVRLMKREGLASSFTLALQTLDDRALETMDRRNMRINSWEGVAEWLQNEGLSTYGELIWGAPGETKESFLRGYDYLATRVPRIAVYPLLVIPNTEYDAPRAEHGLTTVRGSDDDYEYVLCHNTMSIADNFDVQRFMFWARLLAENPFFRSIWPAMRATSGVTQSEGVRSFGDFVEHSGHPVAEALLEFYRPFADSRAIAGALRCLYEHPGTDELFDAWWGERIMPHVPAHLRPFMAEVFRHDWLTRPVYVRPDSPAPLPVKLVDGEPHYVRAGVTLEYDHAASTAHERVSSPFEPVRRPRTLSIVSRVGFFDSAEHHEIAMHYIGRER